MPNINEARKSIYDRMINNYTGVPLEFITFDNEDFKPPLVPWVRLTTRTISSQQDTMGEVGNRIFRTKSTTYVQIFTPINTGARTGDILAIEASNLFTGVNFSGLNFDSSVIKELGPNEKWYCHSVESNFSYDEVK